MIIPLIHATASPPPSHVLYRPLLTALIYVSAKSISNSPTASNIHSQFSLAPTLVANFSNIYFNIIQTIYTYVSQVVSALQGCISLTRK